MAEDTRDDLTQASRDLAHITIGLGVLAFQKAQVQRRSVERAFSAQRSSAATTSGTEAIDVIRRSLRQLRDCR